jgi:hypothetical protein
MRNAFHPTITPIAIIENEMYLRFILVKVEEVVDGLVPLWFFEG